MELGTCQQVLIYGFFGALALGGFVFGIGMTLAGGCSNMKSILVLGVAGFFAYLMTKTDFYGVIFHSWISGSAIDLGQHGFSSQGLDSLIGQGLGIEADWLRYAIGDGIAVVILVLAIGNNNFSQSSPVPFPALPPGSEHWGCPLCPDSR